MRCQWIVRRTMQPAPGGQRRWDRAYQEVLAWMKGPADEPVGASRGPGAREAGHEGGALRSCVDAAPGAGPDGRAAAGTPDGPRAAARLGRAPQERWRNRRFLLSPIASVWIRLPGSV